MRGEMARGEISTAPFASLLARRGTPIFSGSKVLTCFTPIRARFACGRSEHAPIAIEHGTEELLQCKRVGFATAACSRVLVKHRPPVALANSLPAQFITYQTRNSVQSNGASSVVFHKKRSDSSSPGKDLPLDLDEEEDFSTT